MPRGGRSRSPSPTRVPSRSNVPAQPPPRQPMNYQPAPKQPGLLKQSAAIAGGVAAGSVVGHAVGHALVGGAGGYPPPYPAEVTQQQPQQNDPCFAEIQAFLNCAQGQNDLSLCEGFNEAIRACRRQYDSPQNKK